MTDEERTKIENALNGIVKAYREGLVLLDAEDDTLEAIAHAQGIDSPQDALLGAVPDLDISDDAMATPSVPMDARELAERIEYSCIDSNLRPKGYSHSMIDIPMAVAMIERWYEARFHAQAGDSEAILRVHFPDPTPAEQGEERQKQEMRFIDVTPDAGYVARILAAYIDESYWSDNTLGMPPENPLCVKMNEWREQRNKLLREALSSLAAAPRSRPEEV